MQHYIPTPTRLNEHYIPIPTRLSEQVTVWRIMRHTYKTRYTSCRCGGLFNTTYTHLQDSMNKTPVWGIMQHQSHTYKTRYTSRRCGGLCNTTTYPHLQDSINKSPVWGTMHHSIPTLTRLHEQVAGMGANATPTRLDEQVAGMGDYGTPMPHLQDSMNKSPVWGTMQH